MSDAVFARLVQGVRSQAAQVMTGNQSGQTVAAFLQTLGDNHSIVPGEGNCYSSCLHFTFHLYSSLHFGKVACIVFPFSDDKPILYYSVTVDGYILKSKKKAKRLR